MTQKYIFLGEVFSSALKKKKKKRGGKNRREFPLQSCGSRDSPETPKRPLSSGARHQGQDRDWDRRCPAGLSPGSWRRGTAGCFPGRK